MTNPNDPAFPESKIIKFNSGPAIGTMGGLTKREYFAGLIMAQISSMQFSDKDRDLVTPENFAKGSVKLADALIAELSK